MRLRLAALLVLALALSVPSAASAKRHPSAVEAEFTFTGLSEYKLDMRGTALTCPDSTVPYEFEDHVRSHIAFDTVWRVRIPINAGREQRVLQSKRQKLAGSTWSIKGRSLTGSDCDPPQPYDCSGTFKPAAKAPIFFTPVGDKEWNAIMQGPSGIASTPDTCDYLDIHRRILNEIPDEVFENTAGAFNFTTRRLLRKRDKTKTGKFDFGVPADCGSDDTVTCTQSADGSGTIRYHRLRIRYKG